MGKQNTRQILSGMHNVFIYAIRKMQYGQMFVIGLDQHGILNQFMIEQSEEIAHIY